jgi:hypothetical protein
VVQSSGFAAETKAQGDILEGQAYGEAAQLAFKNEQYTKMSTDIQEAQAQRELLLSQGRTQAGLSQVATEAMRAIFKMGARGGAGKTNVSPEEIVKLEATGLAAAKEIKDEIDKERRERPDIDPKR